jgi:nitrile hydratase
MNGVHDMGGMHGFGRIPIEPNEPLFHAGWEGRVLAMQGRGRRAGLFNLDEFRHAIERMPAARYLEASYYERWLTAIETLLLEKGIISREELATGQAAGPVPELAPPAGQRPPLRPRFEVGEAVATRNDHRPGHTRLPRYARGRRGVVRSVHGPFLLPDTNAHLAGRDWEPVYAVEFSAAELWGEGARAGDAVCVDLWESYLKREGET